MSVQPMRALLSAGKAAVAQAALPGHPAEAALDGRADTCWRASPYHAWWQVDLDAVYALTRIVIGTGIPAPGYAHYAVDVSADGLNWAEAVDRRSDAPEPAGGDVHVLETVARHVRITMTYCSTGPMVQLQRVDIYGAEDVLAMSVAPVEGKMLAAMADLPVGFSTETSLDADPAMPVPVVVLHKPGHIRFQAVEFSGLDQFRLCVGLPDPDRTKHFRFQLRLDSPEGEIIADFTLFRQYRPWTEFAAPIERAVTGIHDAYLMLYALPEDACALLHWVQFCRRPALPAPAVHLPPPAPPDMHCEVFFGNLHSHTALSDGMGTPEMAYDHARYAAGLDFLAVTEHSNLFDDMFDAQRSRKWADIKWMAGRKAEEGAFLALYGSETTWYNQFGHMNLYEADFFLNAYEVAYNDIETYYALLKQHPEVIAQWNHPWSCGDRHLDLFEPYDPVLARTMCMIEVNPIELPAQDGLSYYQMALDKGWRVAPIGSQDNHREDWGTQNDLRTGLLMPNLTHAHYVDALRSRRAYFTCAPHLKVLLTAGSAQMGSIVPRRPGQALCLAARNRPVDAPLARVAFVGPGGQVLGEAALDGHADRVTLPIPDGTPFCYAKVWQSDGRFAATAPIWFG